MNTLSEAKGLNVLGINFPSTGIIKNHEGLLHVKIEDKVRKDIFNKLLEKDDFLTQHRSLIKATKIASPYDKKNDIGAHVSFLDFREGNLIPQEKFTEFANQIENTTIIFDKIIGIKKLSDTASSEHLWILELESKQLEKIREGIGLSSTPNTNRFQFHLSIAEIPYRFSPVSSINKIEDRESKESTNSNKCIIL